jgi:Uma2 family endonuclease
MAAPPKRATLDDLMRHEGKAELINGRIVELMPGMRPSEVADNIYSSLRAYVRRVRHGRCHSDGCIYAVPRLPNGRESFMPDASYYVGPLPVNAMGAIEAAPTFAVEVRSESDYGPAAEAEMAAKRDDYFQSGTLVVWDVDPIAEVVRVYQRGVPTPTVFGRADTADAEPAVPGWRISGDETFEEQDP